MGKSEFMMRPGSVKVSERESSKLNHRQADVLQLLETSAGGKSLLVLLIGLYDSAVGPSTSRRNNTKQEIASKVNLQEAL